MERHITDRAAAMRVDGWRALILRPDRTRPGGVALSALASEPGVGPRTTYLDLPHQIDVLSRLLSDQKVDHIQFHHLLDHSPSLRALPEQLGLPYDVMIHDYASICPRLNLIGADGIYCGEPLQTDDCDACVAACGSLLGYAQPVAELRQQSAGWLAEARKVVVPSADVARRLRRYLPNLPVEIMPWQRDVAHASMPLAPASPLRACLVGALDSDKGFGVLLACAQDAAARSLDLEFVVVGHTEDDMALFNTGRVFVTGRYDEPDGLELLRDQRGGVGFLPSLGPETWSYSLTLLWEAGLAVAAFDLGTQAERITRQGTGLLLVPGLPPSRINDALIALHSMAGQHSHDR